MTIIILKNNQQKIVQKIKNFILEKLAIKIEK